MSEIDKIQEAIKYTKECKDICEKYAKRGCNTTLGIQQTILQALEEKQQHQGCEYCNNNKTIIEREEPLLQISIELNHLVMIDMFGIKGAEISYCPMCRRRLSHE